MYKKLVIVTRKTRLQELVERFNTRSQAKFYIEHAGGDFADYEREDDSTASRWRRSAGPWISNCRSNRWTGAWFRRFIFRKRISW